MNWHLDGQTADVEQALAGGTAQPAGWFRFYFADQRWEWSEQVQRMHGYEPGSVTPTTDLVLSHKHPDDRGQVAATIDQIVNTRTGVQHPPSDHRHRRKRAPRRRRRRPALRRRRRRDRNARVLHRRLARRRSRRTRTSSRAKLAEISENRASIEQAKGMLMLIYGISDSAAFDLLKWLSQEANIKLRPLAEQIGEDFRGAGLRLDAQSEFDHLLMTAHQRVAPARRIAVNDDLRRPACGAAAAPVAPCPSRFPRRARRCRVRCRSRR